MKCPFFKNHRSLNSKALFVFRAFAALCVFAAWTAGTAYASSLSAVSESGCRSLPSGSTLAVSAVDDDVPVEVPVTYPGGETALLKFISDNVIYPTVAKEQKLQGTVLLKFEVTAAGEVGKVIIRKSLSPACDAEAIRVVKLLKGWVPAKREGKPVSTWMNLPVRFRIQEK